MLLVGLTGGIATGKSTVVGMLGEMGAVVFSADEAARAVLTPGSRVESEVLARFGDGILQPDGQLSRSKLANLVFKSPERRADLNSILHPPIRRLLLAQIDAVRWDYPPASIVIVEVPLLFEGHMQNWFDLTVLISAPEKAQLQRLIKLRGLDEEQARRRLAAQWSIDVKVSLADQVVANNGSRLQLLESVEGLWDTLRCSVAGRISRDCRA